MTDTPIDTTKLRELLAAATRPPWFADKRHIYTRPVVKGVGGAVCNVPFASTVEDRDAALIVAAVNALGPLLDALDEWKDKHDAVAATRAGVIAQRDDLAARLREAEAELDDNIPDGPLAVEEMDRDDLEAFAHELIAKLRRATAGADGK
jgi:hypothetical protein